MKVLIIIIQISVIKFAFINEWNDREMEEMILFLQMIDSFQKQQLVPNKIVWEEHKDVLFLVKSNYEVLSQTRRQEQIWPPKLI